MRAAPLLRSTLAALSLVAVLPAQAGLFDDEEARRAILDLRSRIDQTGEAQRKKDAELAEQVNGMRGGLLELNATIEQLRAEIARLRGINEQLQRDVSDLQRRQKDVQQGIDDRLRKLEPQKVSVDGVEFLADPEETRQFNEALAQLRGGDFAGAGSAFSAFQRRYPSSGYGPSAQYWLGNALYGKRDYRDAINTFRALVNNSPDHPKAPEAMLAIANCQIELKDIKSARKTLDDLQKAYPKSEAAQAGRQRLAALK
ncbi:tol-pal system protein YbgF [Caldimonas sp. KR1-144]|uniref:tol-pal system protein YbgF n=1 Tax=Caldimonas sp. KR1-144 TaxID=3400911 RepID=UPI003C027BDC